MHTLLFLRFLSLVGLAMALSSSSSSVGGLTSSKHGGGESGGLAVVFLHGLDSSGNTWKDVIPRIATEKIACITMDHRGCGTSSLGNADEFSSQALVKDVGRVLKTHNCDDHKIVLVGHSMGGRIGMAYAATHPSNVVALVIEDMDIARRTVESSPIPIPTTTTDLFERRFNSKQSAIDALLKADYPMERISSWIQDGRIHPFEEEGKFWYSDVNPDFRRLCYQRILDTDLARDIWYNQLCGLEFPVYVLVAHDTICKSESLEEMQSSMDRVVIHKYPEGSTHSIHSSAQDDFVSTLKDIISKAAQSEES